MRLTKEQKGKLEPLRNLSESERASLIQWYVDPDHGAVGELLLESIWNEHAWIECDCVTDIDNPPLMHARKLPGSGYTLVRMPERGRHAETCPFYYEPSMYAGRGTDKQEPLSILESLMLHARLGYLPVSADEDEELLSDQYNRIRRAARSVELAEGIYLHWYLKMRLADMNGLAAKLRRETAKFPLDALPQAFLLLTCSEHQGRIITVGTRNDQVALTEGSRSNCKVVLMGSTVPIRSTRTPPG